MTEANNLWIFSIQDNVCGGLIHAETEDEARRELEKDRKMPMPDEICRIYNLKKLNMGVNKVVDLW